MLLNVYASLSFTTVVVSVFKATLILATDLLQEAYMKKKR